MTQNKKPNEIKKQIWKSFKGDVEFNQELDEVITKAVGHLQERSKKLDELIKEAREALKKESEYDEDGEYVDYCFNLVEKLSYLKTSKEMN